MIKNMKKIIILSIILLISNFCFSQYKDNFILSGGFGFALPGSGLNSYKTGINLNADFQTPFSNTVGLRIDLQYHSVPIEEKEVYGYIEGGRLNLFSFCPNLTIGSIIYKDINVSLALYGIGGLGFFIPSTSDVKTSLGTIREKTADINWGINIGVRGVSKLKNKLGFFNEFGIKYYNKIGGSESGKYIEHLNIGICYFLNK